MKINEETTVSEEQVLFNKLNWENQQMILRIMRCLQPCELSCEVEEEKKIPEKLEDISEIKSVGCKVEINIAGNKTLFDTDTPIVTEHCIYKINQLIKNQKKIIDYLKSKGDE